MKKKFLYWKKKWLNSGGTGVRKTHGVYNLIEEEKKKIKLVPTW